MMSCCEVFETRLLRRKKNLLLAALTPFHQSKPFEVGEGRGPGRLKKILQPLMKKKESHALSALS